MPVARIPLVGNLTSRDDVNTRLFGSSQKDQYFKDCHLEVIRNPITGRTTSYVSARDGFFAATYPSSTSGEGTAIRYWRGHTSPGLSNVLSAWGNTNSTIYYESTSVGDITGQAKFIDETSISDVSTALITSTDNTGWYLPQDAMSATSYTGDTNSNTTINNIASTAGMYAGQAISGSGIPAGTRIATVDSATQITITAAATATAAGVTLTKTPIAKILDSDFPGNAGQTLVGHFAPIDGFAGIMTASGRVYTPALNSLSDWTSTNYIVAQEYPDPGIGAIRYRNYVLALSKGSIEFFQNAGNAAGSPLGRVPHLAQKIGCIGEYAYCEIVNTICWVGSNSGVVGVWMLDGLSPRKISSSVIDLNLENVATTLTRLNVMYSRGKAYLALTTAKSATAVYIFDFETNLWMQWSLTAGLTQSDSPGAGINGVYYLGDDDDNYLFNSLAVAVTGEIQTGPIDFDTMNRKTATRIRLIGDRATAASSLNISWSDDDYATYSTARSIDMTSALPQTHRAGTFRRRGIKISNLGNASTTRRLRLEAIEIDYTVGAT